MYANCQLALSYTHEKFLSHQSCLDVTNLSVRTAKSAAVVVDIWTSPIKYVRRTVVYCLIPVVLFILVINAFFGHLIFGSLYDQTINKYSIYVHLNPEWESYPGNILFEVTNVWSGNPDSDGLDVYVADPHNISDLTSYNENQLQHQRAKSYVELKHEFSDCKTDWRPMLYRYVVDDIRDRLEVLRGIQVADTGDWGDEPTDTNKGSDPYVSIFPDVHNNSYDADEQIRLLEQGYVQFIPICTVAQDTAYDYSVMINDRTVGFDVYFVPSADQVAAYLENDSSFEYYSQPGCFAHNRNSFTGTCKDLGPDSGLMVVLPDKLDLSLTKIRISLLEQMQLT